MCGITGIFHFDSNRIADQAKLRAMTDIIRHRGPDGEGFYTNQNIGLGHRRLSIIDLSTGDQPMFNEDKSIALVLNGEIYNYLELREELKKLGYHFRTTSDTEVIIRSYQEWGLDCQHKFNGMWAFALWDSNKEQLFLSRDRIGEKPLNYSVVENTLIFASEIKSLFEYGIPREIRPELIELYLVLTNIPAPDTFYKNVYKLKPGHYIIANSSGIKELKYWDLPEIDEHNMLKNKPAIYDEFTYLFEDSVKIRMRADVPFGAFLSGGLDSSSIVALMSKNSSHPIESFTIGFPQKTFDESDLAQLVAEKFNTHHHLGTVKPDSLKEAIQRSVFHFDEPFGDSSAIPTHQVSNFAVNTVKMVLTGDGGDEVLSGYNSYAGIKLSGIINKFPLAIQKNFSKGTGVLAKKFAGNFRYKLNRIENILATAHYPFDERMANKTSYVPLPIIKALTASLKNHIRIEDYLNEVVSNMPYKNDFYKLMYLNFKFDLPNDYLVKVDRMSMANSLETRAPFLDYRLIEFMVKVDKGVKMQGWERKSILRKTIGKQLPVELMNAPKKGFGAPLREWFKNDSSSDFFKFEKIKHLLDNETLEFILDENNSGQRDGGNFIWTLIMLDNILN